MAALAHELAERPEKAERLATRFANWYYVVAADSYDRIHHPKEHFLKEIEEG